MILFQSPGPPSLLPALMAGLLAWGCAPPAESAELGMGEDLSAAAPSAGWQDTALQETPSSREAPPLDPLDRHLQVPPVGRALQEEVVEDLRGAMELREREDHRGAAARVDSILAALPALSDWRPLIRAELLAPAGDTLAVRLALEELANSDESGELNSRWAWSFRVEAHLAASDTLGAISAAETEGRRRGPGASAAWARAGELSLARQDTASARTAFLRALEDGSFPAGARRAALALDRFHPGSPEEGLAIGRALLAAGAWGRAHDRVLPLLDERDLPGAEREELRLGLGRALVELARPGEALAVLSPLLGEEGGASPQGVTSALFWAGRAHLGRGARDAARDAFHRISRLDPGNAMAEQGFLLLLDSAPSAAVPSNGLLEGLLEVGVGSPDGEMHAVRYGAGRYLAGDYREAARTFERYLEGARRTASRQQAAYWAGLAHERRGEEDRARELLQLAWEEDPISFYGTLAGERLGASVLPSSLPRGPVPSQAFAGEMENALLRLRVHQVLPTPGSFAFELERLQEYFFQRGDAAYDLAETLIEGGLPIQGVVLGREIHRREGDWNLRLLRIVHPFPFRDSIVRESRARGLDPFFVAAVIRQESLFHSSIQSSAGAVGLMQLLPGTAREVARSLGIRYDPQALEDPDYNVRLGTHYLASMLGRFGGRAEDALSAYNAGPRRINQWRQRPEYRDRDVFMEHIPFRETRHYVKVVQQYTRVYTALYGCPGFEPCLGESYAAVVARSPYAGGAPASSLAR